MWRKKVPHAKILLESEKKRQLLEARTLREE